MECEACAGAMSPAAAAGGFRVHPGCGPLEEGVAWSPTHWRCLDCGQHRPGGSGLLTLHRFFACPATATGEEREMRLARMAMVAGPGIPTVRTPERLSVSVRPSGACACGEPGRLYAHGVFCDAHNPRPADLRTEVLS